MFRQEPLAAPETLTEFALVLAIRFGFKLGTLCHVLDLQVYPRHASSMSGSPVAGSLPNTATGFFCRILLENVTGFVFVGDLGHALEDHFQGQIEPSGKAGHDRRSVEEFAVKMVTSDLGMTDQVR